MAAKMLEDIHAGVGSTWDEREELARSITGVAYGGKFVLKLSLITVPC